MSEDGLKREMVRVNTRISEKANAWLDKESNESGIPKSTLILLAVENYIQQKEAFAMMADMGQVVHKLDALEKAIKSNDKKMIE